MSNNIQEFELINNLAEEFCLLFNQALVRKYESLPEKPNLARLTYSALFSAVLKVIVRFAEDDESALFVLKTLVNDLDFIAKASERGDFPLTTRPKKEPANG